MRLRWLLVAALTACSAGQTPVPVTEKYVGYYRSGFEATAFHPQGFNERWWLKGAVPCSGFNVGQDVAGWPAKDWVHLAVEGTISPKGNFGHMGGYDREITVTKVVSCRSLRAGEQVEF